MRKQKRESLMFNNSIKSLSCIGIRHKAQTIFTLLFTLFIAACSVTPDGTHTGNKTLSPESNKLYVEAISKMKSGNSKQAQLILTKIIRQQPDFSNAHVNLAILYIKMKRFKKADTSLKQALKISPNNIYALNQLGFLYRRNGDFAKAKENYEKAININSEYAYAHLNLGILYDLYLYDLENAIEQYKIYNKLSKDEDKQVSKWIFDLERRHKKSLSQK